MKKVSISIIDFGSDFNNDLEPFPTLYHWDLPIRFSKIGGWENKDTCKHFADYSYFVSQQFGDKFDKVTTINEHVSHGLAII